MKSSQKHFQVIAAIGVIAIGVLGVIVGGIVVWHGKDITIAVACITLASTALGILGGVLTAQKINRTSDDIDTTPDS
jgi:hypothetical protein